MSVMETTPRIEKKFDEDRVENPPVTSPTRPLNLLRTAKSAPVSSIPRESLLVRSPTSLLTSTAVDHGLMDMWVDDGTCGNINDTTRMLRFSTAASTIDGLFYSPTVSQGSNAFKREQPLPAIPTLANQTHLSLQETDNKDASLDSAGLKPERPIAANINPQGLNKASEGGQDASAMRMEEISTVRKQDDVLETEPVTPPRADGPQLGEGMGSSEAPNSTENASSGGVTPRWLRQDGASKKSFGSGREKVTEPTPETAPPTRRRLSALFSRKDDTPEIRAPSQSSEIPQDLRGTKRGSKLPLVNIFRRSSARAATNTPQPAIGSVQFHGNTDQPEGKHVDKDVQVCKPKSQYVSRTEAEDPPASLTGKEPSDRSDTEGAQMAENAGGLKEVSSEDQTSPKGGGKQKMLNFFRRRSTLEPRTSNDAENGSGHNIRSSGEQNEPLRDKGPRKIITLVKKLSSGFRERVGGETRVENGSKGKEPISTAVGIPVSPEGIGHSAIPNICEGTEREEVSPSSLERKARSPEGSRQATPGQPADPVSAEQPQIATGDRQILARLLKGFSSGSKDRTPESNAEGQQEVRQETPNKGAFFAKLFKRKSSHAEEKESETATALHQGDDDDGPPPGSPAPPESQTWWGQFSQKVTRFLGMLVH